MSLATRINFVEGPVSAVDDDVVIFDGTSGRVVQDSGAKLSDFAVVAHTHDGDTLQLDGVNSDDGAFNFTTTGLVTFNQSVTVTGDVNVGAGHTGTLSVSGSIHNTRDIITDAVDAADIDWEMREGGTPVFQIYPDGPNNISINAPEGTLTLLDDSASVTVPQASTAYTHAISSHPYVRNDEGDIMLGTLVNQGLVPNGDATYDVGQGGNRWRDFHISRNITDDVNTVTVSNLEDAYDHSQVTGNDGIHGTNYLRNNESDTMGGILTCDGIEVGDTEYIEFGAGDGAGGDLGCDGRFYSDGDDLILQVESITSGIGEVYENPSMLFTYFDVYATAEIGAFIPAIVMNPSGGPSLVGVGVISHFLYVQDIYGVEDPRIIVAKPLANAGDEALVLSWITVDPEDSSLDQCSITGQGATLSITATYGVNIEAATGKAVTLGDGGDTDYIEISDAGVLTFNGAARFFPPQVDDDGMDSTDGTEGEIVFNLDDDTFYGCTVTGSAPTTWVPFH